MVFWSFFWVESVHSIIKCKKSLMETYKLNCLPHKNRQNPAWNDGFSGVKRKTRCQHPLHVPIHHNTRIQVMTHLVKMTNHFDQTKPPSRDPEKNTLKNARVLGPINPIISPKNEACHYICRFPCFNLLFPHYCLTWANRPWNKKFEQLIFLNYSICNPKKFKVLPLPK